VLVLGAVCANVATGCAGLSAPVKASIEAAAADACPFEVLLPGVGPELATSCAGQEAALASALDETGGVPPAAPAAPAATCSADAGAVASKATPSAKVAAKVPVYRPLADGTLVRVGSVARERAAKVQQALLHPGQAAAQPRDAGAEGGAP
jgi:hypothetical protein